MSVTVKKDGRTILTDKDYTNFRFKLWMSQDRSCARCKMLVSISEPYWRARSFHVHHKNGRGMGGGKRSDTFLACVGLCRDCHMKGEHGQ